MGTASHKKILVVEDEQDILQLVKHYLEKEGFRPIPATNGLEALKKVKEEKPDLVVLDLMLPELDGLERKEWGQILYCASHFRFKFEIPILLYA
ncbi:MAG: response regulator [Nitrospira sp.]|nr:response regulator [Nitrospira sp.]